MPLGVNRDSTYADSATDPSQKLHQQDHDALHAFYNAYEGTAPADFADAADVTALDTRVDTLEADTTASDHIADTTDAHDATAVSVAATPTNYTAATPDVEAHLAGIDAAIVAGGGGGGGTTVSAFTTLTNKTPNSTTFVQWGTEEAVVAQADAPASAVVVAWVSGTMIAGPSPTVGDRGQIQGEVSFDGGSTWANMSGLEVAPGLISTDINISVPINRVGRATGTVTGDIQVRVQCRDVNAANDIAFDRGTISIMVHEQ